MKTLLSWLSKPYYFNPNLNFKFRFSFYFGLFVFLFLYIFRPFYLSLFDVIILEYTIGIGLIAFLGTFFMLYVPPLFFKEYFNEDNWTVGRSLFLVIIGVLFIGTLLWYFGEMYKEPFQLRKLSLIEYLTYSLLVTSLPMSLYTFHNERIVSEKRQKRISQIRNYRKQQQDQKKETLTTKIKLYSDNKKEFISFDINNLVYITSQGNYASFFIKKDNSEDLKEEILRVTLSKIDAALENYTTIIRCHKSYIVNTKFMYDIAGNARGYLLKSKLISFEIPVSRKFNKNSLLSLLN